MCAWTRAQVSGCPWLQTELPDLEADFEGELLKVESFPRWGHRMEIRLPDVKGKGSLPSRDAVEQDKIC